jgi:hypothetical protein
MLNAISLLMGEFPLSTDQTLTFRLTNGSSRAQRAAPLPRFPLKFVTSTNGYLNKMRVLRRRLSAASYFRTRPIWDCSRSQEEKQPCCANIEA